MKVAIGGGLDTNENWDELTTFVQEAERLGVDSVWSAEAWGLDGATILAFLAAKTSRIKLGSGILQTVGRTPANLAMTAMSLASMSDGRFMLGLGASGPQVVEGWHGVPFKKPIRRIRETIEIVRLVSSGEKLAYEGEIFQLPLDSILAGVAGDASTVPEPTRRVLVIGS
jgi:alkanesulfonate monooxygenase SsuD/methylene tetrahydromethanopterin reductase-like flavin-dependent oxidoreductase (luciferase family)